MQFVVVIGLVPAPWFVIASDAGAQRRRIKDFCLPEVNYPPTASTGSRHWSGWDHFPAFIAGNDITRQAMGMTVDFFVQKDGDSIIFVRVLAGKQNMIIAMGCSRLQSEHGVFEVWPPDNVFPIDTGLRSKVEVHSFFRAHRIGIASKEQEVGAWER